MPQRPGPSFTPHLASLPPGQQAMWKGLQPVAEDGFVLYGGTAISLQLGHRVSMDFDFFSRDPLDQDWLLKRYPFCADATVIQAAPDTLTILVPGEAEGVKVSFFGGITHGRVGTPTWTTDGVLLVASLEDLLGTKLKTIQQRVEKKDYVDIHAILASGLRLENGLTCAQTLYGRAFHPIVALKALGYFGDGDLGELSKKVKKDLVKAIEQVKELPPIPNSYPSLGVER